MPASAVVAAVRRAGACFGCGGCSTINVGPGKELASLSLRPRSRRAGAGCVYESVAPAFSVLLAADTWESRQTCA